MKNWRINLIFVVYIVFGAVVVGRLFFIQILQNEFYRALAHGLHGIDEKIEGKRGEIFLKNKEALAINMEWPLVFASPIEVDEKEEAAQKLSEILNMEKETILEKLQKENFYEVIKKRITDKEVEDLKSLDLKGISLAKEVGRYYPQQTFASKVAGFLNAEQVGQYGIEEYYNKTLQGKGNIAGNNIFLTIDYPVQFTAEKLLAEAKENLNIEGGEIIVVEPFSGEILALASFPNFDPNNYSEVSDLDIFQNSATQKIFEPGSVFKPITMAGALEERKITPKTTYTDEGKVKIGGYVIYNYDNRVWGEKTMTEVLERSINTGAVFVEKQLGHELFLKYIEKFKFFEKTGIDIREIYSENKEFKKGYEINFATASFGQGIEITPIQLVRAYCAIANGGKMVKPYFVEKIEKEGKITEIKPEVSEEAVISPKTASQLTAMLVSVVEDGFAKSAQVPGYYIAGKTGTAQIAWSALGEDKKGYSDKTWQTFIGFAPAFNPKFVIMVKLDNPETKTAEYSAVPIFHKLSKYLIDYYQIPPDYQEE